MPARVGPMERSGRGLASGDIVLAPVSLPSQDETIALSEWPGIRSDTATRRNQRDPFIITIEDEESASGQPENPETSTIFKTGCTYMKDLFDILHYMGLYHHPTEDKIFSWKSALHLAAFGMTSILALMWELGLGKHYIMDREKKKTLFYIITLWYFFQAAVVSIYFLRIVVGNSISVYRGKGESIEENGSVGTKSSKMSKVMIAIFILNVAMAGYMASGANGVLFDEDVTGFDDILIYRATQFKSRLFLWQKKDYPARIREMENVTDPTTEHVVYGSMEIGLKFFGWLHYLMVKDTVLSASLTLRYYTNTYKEFLDENGNERISYPFLRMLWVNWDPMHQVSSKIESRFGNLFKLLFVDNFLFGAYIVLDFMDEEFQFDGAFVINLIVMGKVLYAYITAAIAGKLGSRVTSRLYKNSPEVGSNDTEMMTNIGYFEKKIEKSPVAMGSGLFLVNEEFVYKFIGLVMSNALFVRDHQKEEAAAT